MESEGEAGDTRIYGDRANAEFMVNANNLPLPKFEKSVFDMKPDYNRGLKLATGPDSNLPSKLNNGASPKRKGQSKDDKGY